MRILHIGTNDRFGGASIAAYRLHTALRRDGVDSRMWVRFKVTDDDSVEQFTPDPRLTVRLPRIARRYSLDFQQRRSGMRDVMFDSRSEHAGAELEGMPPADLVNIQFAWGFVDYPALFSSIPESVPIVVSMHDMANFTGGCAYSSGCDRFRSNCGSCPKLEQSGPSDLSRMQWERLSQAFSSRPKDSLHFVANSKWLAHEARRSGLLEGLPVSVIHLGVDTEVFKPLDRGFARNALGIPKELPVVAFAAASVDDSRKGIAYLIDAIEGMPEKPFLLTWGRCHPPKLKSVPHRHLGNLDNEHLTALAYNASDVFAMPSLEEAFGQTALESIACGTPVAAFSAGGIVDTVRHEKTGLLADVGDNSQLRDNIVRLLEDTTLIENCGQEGVRLAKEEFSYERNAAAYRELYASLL